jgi:transcriptional regulator with XRE-family HTH domain
MPRKTAPLPPTLKHTFKQLGENIRLARLRRKITTTMLAERAGMSRNTLRAIERGDSAVTMGAYASVLFCLGLEKDLLVIAQDDVVGSKVAGCGFDEGWEINNSRHEQIISKADSGMCPLARINFANGNGNACC